MEREDRHPPDITRPRDGRMATGIQAGDLAGAVLDGLRIGVACLDPDGGVAYANRHARMLAAEGMDLRDWLRDPPLRDPFSWELLERGDGLWQELTGSPGAPPMLAGLEDAGGRRMVLRISCDTIARDGPASPLVVLRFDPLGDGGPPSLGPGQEGDRVADIAHDMGNALGTIRLSAEAITLAAGDGPMARAASSITQACTRCDALLSDLLPGRPAPSPAPPAPDRALEGLALLLAEDDVLFGEMLQQTLLSQGANVYFVSKAGAAMELGQDLDKLDMLITDLGLGTAAGGEDLAARMRAERPDLKVLLISGRAGPEAMTADGTTTAFLRKPIAERQLVQALLGLVGHRAGR